MAPAPVGFVTPDSPVHTEPAAGGASSSAQQLSLAANSGPLTHPDPPNEDNTPLGTLVDFPPGTKLINGFVVPGTLKTFYGIKVPSRLVKRKCTTRPAAQLNTTNSSPAQPTLANSASTQNIVPPPPLSLAPMPPLSQPTPANSPPPAPPMPPLNQPTSPVPPDSPILEPPAVAKVPKRIRCQGSRLAAGGEKPKRKRGVVNGTRLEYHQLDEDGVLEMDFGHTNLLNVENQCIVRYSVITVRKLGSSPAAQSDTTNSSPAQPTPANSASQVPKSTRCKGSRLAAGGETQKRKRVVVNGTRLEFHQLDEDEELEMNFGHTRRRNKYSSSRDSTESFIITMKPSYLRSLCFPLIFSEANMFYESCSEISIKDDEGKSWPVKISLKRGNMLYTAAGWQSFVEGNNLREGDKFKLHIISKGKIPFLSFHRIDMKRHARQKAEVPQPGTYFICTSTQSKLDVSRLFVSKKFAKRYDLANKCRKIILRSSEGKHWVATLKHQDPDNCRFFITTGWGDFALAKGLLPGCLFMLEIIETETEVLNLKVKLTKRVTSEDIREMNLNSKIPLQVFQQSLYNKGSPRAVSDLIISCSDFLTQKLIGNPM